MTQLVDQPIAAGATLPPRSARATPDIRAAEAFYLHGWRPVRQITIQVARPDGSLHGTWLAAHVEDQINQLLRLQPGWDGGRARPLTDEAVRAALRVLFAIADDLVLPPQMFPVPDGGLQLEWHAHESVEIEVDADGDVHVMTTDEAGEIALNREFEIDDDSVLSQVRDAIRHLSARLAGAR